MREYHWASFYGVIADADDADVDTIMTVVSADGVRKEVIVVAVQYFTAQRSGKAKVRCLVEEIK